MRLALLLAALLLAPLFAPVGAAQGGGAVTDSPPSFPVWSANRTVVEVNGGAIAFYAEVQEPNGEADIALVGLDISGATVGTPTHTVTAIERNRTAEPASFGADGFKVWTGSSAIDGRLYVRYQWTVGPSTAPGVHAFRVGTYSSTGVTTLSAAYVNVTVTASSTIAVASTPVLANGTAATGASWGGWEAAPGERNVSAGNYLKITNLGTLTRPRVVLDFTGAAFTGPDGRTSVPIGGNVEFAWWEDTTPGSTAPSQGTYAYLPANTEGSVTLGFTGVGNIIYVTYRLSEMPSVLLQQAYTASFTVTEIEPLPDTSAVADPGQAYEDVACDGLYHSATDLLLTNASVRDGVHETGNARCLVIPAGVGAISAPSIRYTSNAGVTLGVNVNATSGSLYIGGSSLDATGRTLAATGAADVVLGTGMARMNASTVRSTTSTVRIDHDGRLYAVGAAFRAHTDLDVVGAALPIVADNAAWSSSTTRVTALTNGALAAPNLNATAPSHVSINATGALLMPNATLRSTAASVWVDSTGDVLNLTYARVQSAVRVSLASTGNMDLQRTTLIGSGGDALLADLGLASRTLYVQGATFDDANKRLSVTPATTNVVGSPASGNVRV